jgi:hypothetical protein
MASKQVSTNSSKSSSRATHRTGLTRARAKRAVRKIGKQFETRTDKTPAAWQKGGKEWSRVLGHFGASK